LEDTPLTFNIFSEYYDDTNYGLNQINIIRQPLSYSISSPPLHGDLKVANSSSSYHLTYVPDPNFNGDDHFDITFMEGIVLARTVSFSIIVLPVNDPPVAKDNLVLTSVNEPVNIQESSMGKDPDDDKISIEIVSDPEHGKIRYLDGLVEYTPIDGFVGKDRFNYVLSDSHGALSSQGMVVVLVQDPGNENSFQQADQDDIRGISPTEEDTTDIDNINYLPVALAGQDQTVKAGMSITLNGSNSFDPDGTITSYHWEQLKDSDQVPRIVLSGIGDSPTGIVTFTVPNATKSHTLDFRLTVIDNNGNSASDIVSIKIISSENRPPIANAGENIKVQEKEKVVLDASASVDPDNDSLSYSWLQEDDGQELISLKDANSINPSFTAPSVDKHSETFTFILRVDDQRGGVDYDSVKIHVSNVNRSPIAVASKNQTVGEAVYIRLDGSRSSDPDRDQLTYKWRQIEGPEVPILNPSSPKFTFKTPTSISGTNQTLVFTLEVSDGSLTATDTVTIVVEDTIKPPQILKTPDFRRDLVREIDQAGKFVYASMYFVEDYGKNRVLDALERAVERGIDVRITFALQNLELYPTIKSDLAERGIPYKIVANHAKVIVIDDEITYVGSANLNKNGLEDNWELTVKTNNLDTVREAKQFINLAWTSGSTIVTFNNYEEENFVNGNEYYELLHRNIENAEEIKMIMYEAKYNFKDKKSVDTKLLDALKKAFVNGAELDLIFDNPRYYEAYGGKQFLTRNNIPHKVDDKVSGTLERLHAKAILIDDKILFIGSQNLNADSLDSSAEAAIVTTNPETISQFLQIFKEKWDVGRYVVEPDDSNE
jgi:hypothetical protein